LTTVANKVVSKEVDEAVINRSIGILDRELEVIIGFVQLVPEEKI